MERPSNWDTPGERVRAVIGHLLGLVAEFGASFHPGAAEEFYAYRQRQRNEQDQIDNFRRQLESATADDFRD